MALKISAADLRAHGVFAFPQERATVLCDTADLRFSVGNDEKYFFAQAIVWRDDNSGLGKDEDGRATGDYGSLQLDTDANGEVTPNVDRLYFINSWPGRPGLAYQVWLRPGAWTTLKTDTGGRGAIRYVSTPEGRRIRVDTLVIPLAEIGRKVGDKIRFCYYGWSPQPELTVDSAGFGTGGLKYYGYQIPIGSYHEYALHAGEALAIEQVPDGKTDVPAVMPRKLQTAPVAGTMAPEITAKEWINAGAAAPSLAALRGKVVLVEFWATWCGPCVKCIPRLIELDQRYRELGLTIVALTDQPKRDVEGFVRQHRMNYLVGTGKAENLERYGVSGIPRAFLVDESGKIVWSGHSAAPALENEIRRALKVK